MGFLNANKRKPELEALNVIRVAMDMLDIIQNVREELQYQDLDMRIGIHTVRQSNNYL
jgi:hypothetical protein